MVQLRKQYDKVHMNSLISSKFQPEQAQNDK